MCVVSAGPTTVDAVAPGVMTARAERTSVVSAHGKRVEGAVATACGPDAESMSLAVTLPLHLPMTLAMTLPLHLPVPLSVPLPMRTAMTTPMV